MLRGTPVTTWAGGAANWQSADWRVLTGKRVLLWPDNDEPGLTAMLQLGAHLAGVLDCKVELVHVPADRPPAWDVADLLAAGDDVRAFIKQHTAALPEPDRRFTDITETSITWLWQGYIPRGKLCLLDGDPGTGKSTLMLDLAARVSAGKAMPDGSASEQGTVLLASAEDDAADTILPRLRAAGANLGRVVELGPPFDLEGKPRPLTLADASYIETRIRHHKAALLVMDPLMAFMPSGTDSNVDSDVRVHLAGLRLAAERTGCAIVLVRHLNKSGGTNPVYRGGGSIGFIGAARMGFLVAPAPADDITASKARRRRRPLIWRRGPKP